MGPEPGTKSGRSWARVAVSERLAPGTGGNQPGVGVGRRVAQLDPGGTVAEGDGLGRFRSAPGYCCGLSYSGQNGVRLD